MYQFPTLKFLNVKKSLLSLSLSLSLSLCGERIFDQLPSKNLKIYDDALCGVDKNDDVCASIFY